ncbi:MAG: type II toxin-antitoxin system HipA family toxin [Gammaproteobacteria bacterium]
MATARRRAAVRQLSLWANGAHVGEWRLPNRGSMELQYAKHWLESDERRPLSLCLPLTLDDVPLKGRPVEAYFDNLLPDNDALRKRVQQRFRAPSAHPFDLLSAIGRDCVGAVQLLSVGELPVGLEKIEAEPLSEAALARAIAASLSPAAVNIDSDEFRISIAGAQEKTAFLKHRGRWCRPHGATPTTHIFKLPLGLVGNMRADMSTSVENEWLCSRILAAYGLPIARCDIERFGDFKVLVVERFDRILHSSGKYWLRLMQEDLCQALATPSSNKYEADGGPGLRDIGRVLRGSANRTQDLSVLLKAQILFWMLAATDGHAKNFSVRILPGGQYQLTPLYDVLSAWPIIGKRANQLACEKARLALAMHSTRAHYRIRDIQRRHFDLAARHLGVAANADAIVTELLEATPGVLAGVQKGLPRSFPARVLGPVLEGLEKSSRLLLQAERSR